MAYKLISGDGPRHTTCPALGQSCALVPWLDMAYTVTPFRLRYNKQKVQNSVVQQSDIGSGTSNRNYGL